MAFLNQRVARGMGHPVERSGARRGGGRRIVEAVALVACASAALLPPPSVAGESRWYIAGRFGEASADWAYGPPVFGWTFDGSDDLAAIDVGYAAHRFLSIQAGYADFGTYRGTPRACPQHEECPRALPSSLAEVDLGGYSLAAVPRWPFAPRAALYAKVGWLHWEADLHSPNDERPLRGASGDELLLGAGAEYRFAGGFGLNAEYEETDMADSFAIGASWRF